MASQHQLRPANQQSLFSKWLKISFASTSVLAALVFLGCAAWHESFYWDRAAMLAPVAYDGQIPIRNDWRGEGDFGAKRNGNRRHQGLDFSTPLGAPVLAAKGGLATCAENKKGLGKFIVVRHKSGLTTVYAHLFTFYIQPRQMVRQGQLIGAVGNTGNAKYNGIDPHLHFEVRENGTAVDPKKYL